MFSDIAWCAVIAASFGLLLIGRGVLSRRTTEAPILEHVHVPGLWLTERTIETGWGFLIFFTLVFPSLLWPLPLGSFGRNEALRFAGLALLVVAGALQLIAKSQLGANWSNAVEGPRVHAGAITTHGLYRWCRHPMYCCTLAINVALNLLLQNAAAVMLGVVAFRYVRKNVVNEEAAFLAHKKDEYAEYAAHVPSFFEWW